MKNINKITFASVFSALSLSGCQQYLERHDGVTTHAGNHLAANEAKLVVDPWNPNAYNNHIEGDGKRLGDAVKRYKDANKADSEKGQETLVLPTLPTSETNE
ncbi:MAG: hypothetical protein AAF423_07195 [Pseudomonadota bacterium]